VHELSLDVCLAARSSAEGLKCLQALVHTLYPARAALQGPAASSGAGGSSAASQPRPPAPPADPWGGGNAPGAQPPQEAQQPAGSAACWTTEEEVAAAYLLYFACVPPRPMLLQVVAVLSILSAATLASAPVQLALRLLAAITAGDYVSLFRLQPRCPRRMRLVLAEAHGKVGRRAAPSPRATRPAAWAAALGGVLGQPGRPLADWDPGTLGPWDPGTLGPCQPPSSTTACTQVRQYALRSMSVAYRRISVQSVEMVLGLQQPGLQQPGLQQPGQLVTDVQQQRQRQRQQQQQPHGAAAAQSHGQLMGLLLGLSGSCKGARVALEHWSQAAGVGDAQIDLLFRS
jgi:hypothetical protein